MAMPYDPDVPLKLKKKDLQHNFCSKPHSAPSLILNIFLISLIFPSIAAVTYPDYEFNQRITENQAKTAKEGTVGLNKRSAPKNQQERASYRTVVTKKPTAADVPDDDIIVTKPVACLESTGRKPPNCDYLSEQAGHIIYPVVHIGKRQVTGSEYEESTSGYAEKTEDDDEDDEEEEEGGNTNGDDDDDEDDDDDGDDNNEIVIDGDFKRNEDYDPLSATTTEPSEGASRLPALNRHNTHGKNPSVHRVSPNEPLLTPVSQPPFMGNNQPHHNINIPRNNIDMSSSYMKDRQYQQLTAKMNILLIAGIAAGIVVLLFILVLAACKFYTSSTGAASAKAMNDYQRTAGKTAYAYEACNTGAKCSSPLLVPTSQQSLTPLNASSQAGLTNVASSATNTATKPAKKDVKEWYV